MSDIMPTDDSVPAYLRGRKAVPMQGITADDIATPRLLLLQALSPQVEEGLGKAGNLFHSGAEREIGADAIITPLFVTKAYTLWRPRPEGGILARSRDGISWDRTGTWQVKLRSGQTVTWKITVPGVEQSGLADWGSMDPNDPDSKPAAVLSYNIPVMVHGHLECGPAVLQLQRSQIKAAKKLLGRLRNCPHPYYSLKIPISVFKDSSDEGPFYNLRFGKFGFVLDEDECDHYMEMYHTFADKGVTVQEETEEPTSNGAEDEEGEMEI